MQHVTPHHAYSIIAVVSQGHIHVTRLTCSQAYWDISTTDNLYAFSVNIKLTQLGANDLLEATNTI